MLGRPSAAPQLFGVRGGWPQRRQDAGVRQVARKAKKLSGNRRLARRHAGAVRANVRGDVDAERGKK
jgi:hypothetical protein